ncbi:MAG TPA: hypothetical protein VGP89_05010, partial [Candidatus Angelobacter sp.]|nr:hypothetical protein [Candidatus Angelobacter sp.]
MAKHSKISLSLILTLANVASFAAVAFAVEKEHATLIREESLHVSAGANAEKLVQVGRGTDLVVLDHTNADNQTWIKALVTLEQGAQGRQVTGWIPRKTVITAATANGDEIV